MESSSVGPRQPSRGSTARRGSGPKPTDSDDSSQTAANVSGSKELTLGTRIFGWTNNLLASAIVIAIALTFGLQAIGFWHTSRPEPPPINRASDRETVARAESAIQWNLGSWSGRWLRDEFVGTRSELQQRLISRMSETLTQDPAAAGFTTPGALALVKTLSERDAAWHSESGDEVYVQEGPIPLAMAVRRDSSGNRTVVAWGVALAGAPLDDSASPENSVPAPEPDPETSGQIEVEESTLAPALSRRWIVTVCRPTDPTQQKSALEQPLPESCQVTFAVDDPKSGVLIGFQSKERIDRLIAAIDAQRQDLQQEALQWNVTTNEAWGTAGDQASTRIRLLIETDRIRGLWTQAP